MPGADGMSSKFMKNAFVGWTFTAGLYYPPDFDSTKLMPLKHLRPKGQQQAMNIRMMFPFTMICDACGEYNYTGTKFTARVEDIKHECYLGIKVYRFYGRCRHCWAEFTFKTDPKNSDYTMESGGKRTYEAWKDADMMEAQLKAEKEKEAAEDQMKALEQKAVDVQAEMQRLEDLDAIRTMNRRLGSRDQTIEEALEFLFKKAEKEDAEQDSLRAGELKELEGFKLAQEVRRRQQLDEAVEGGGSVADEESVFGGASSSAASSSSATLAGADGAARSVGASAGDARGAAIASAIAERIGKQQRARPKLSVKRKAPAGQGDGGNAETDAADEARGDSAKRRCAPASPAAASGGLEVAAGPSAAADEADGGGAGGLGLGAYDSDSS